MKVLVSSKLRKIASNLSSTDMGTLINLPSTRQSREWSCGAACTQSVFGYYGIDFPEIDFIKELKTTAKWGTELKDIIKIAKDTGFKVEAKSMDVKELRSFIDRKIPVIIEIQAWSDNKNPDYENTTIDAHLVVCCGYSSENFVFMDPWKLEKTYLTYDELDDRWHCYDRTKKKLLTKYGIAIYGKPVKFDKKTIIPME